MHQNHDPYKIYLKICELIERSEKKPFYDRFEVRDMLREILRCL